MKLNARIGVLGEPSDWLVSSDVDYSAAKARWGVEYVDIPLDRVNAYYQEILNNPDMRVQESIRTQAELFGESSVGIREPKNEDIRKAVILYRAIHRIVEEEKLDAVTVKCFDLIPTTGTTGCLALALLDDEGIPAGCEGDLQSIFTKLYVKRVTGQDCFMANPAFIRRNEVLFAHCTIGLKQVRKYIVRSHFESGMGVAIQGILPEGETYTIVKIGGKSLERMEVYTATLIENQDDARKCRTQVLLHTNDGELSRYLLSRSIGNHHILVRGDWKELLNEEFFVEQNTANL